MKDIGTKQSEDMRVSIAVAQSAAQASNKSAEVAAQTVRSIESTAERQLRAYVGVEKGQLLYERVDQNHIKVKSVLRIINVGQTPAHNVISLIGVERAKKFSDSMNSKKMAVMGTSYLFPAGTHRIFGFNSIIDMSRDDQEIFVFGEICYTDSFDIHRWTKFRYTVKSFDIHSGTAELAACDDGNSAS